MPPMANVLKVFLENGQTKSFKYDATTSVQVFDCNVINYTYICICFGIVNMYIYTYLHILLVESCLL